MNKDNNTVEQVVLQKSVALQFMPVFLSKFILIYTLKIKKWYKETQSLWNMLQYEHYLPKLVSWKHNPDTYINISRRWDLPKVTWIR